MQDVKKQQINSAIDIMKLVMAVLVVGIHTEPFHANIWLDRGFGMITRLCLPFFFAASAYFFFKSGKPLKAYLGRIILLYAVWSFIYLPFVLDCWQLGAYVLLIPLLLKILRGGYCGISDKRSWNKKRTVLCTSIPLYGLMVC